jgi:hypothetical protein
MARSCAFAGWAGSRWISLNGEALAPYPCFCGGGARSFIAAGASAA